MAVLSLSRALIGFALLAVPILAAAQPATPAADEPLSSPARIAAIAGGPLLVTDYAAGAVCTVGRAKLHVLHCFTVEGRPLAVAWAHGRVYVGNETTGAVEVYNRRGKLQYILGGEAGTVKEPSDIAIDEPGRRVFVVDGSEKNVKVFDLHGSLLYTFTGGPSPEGTLVNPTGIAIDAVSGEVIVSDYGNPGASYPAKIGVYDAAGNYLRRISGKAGGFSRPQGMAADNGFIYLADGMLGQVLVFNSVSGGKVKTLGSFGAGPGQLMLPLDVLVDGETKNVFVTNNRLGRVELFTEGGLAP